MTTTVLTPDASESAARRRPDTSAEHARTPDEDSVAYARLATPGASRFSAGGASGPDQPGEGSKGGAVAVALRRAQQSQGNRYVQAMLSRSNGRIQRKCACGGTCSSCQAEAAAAAFGEEDVHAAVAQAQGHEGEQTKASAYVPASPGAGHSLDESTRQTMGAVLGSDLSNVRIHTDAAAGASAEQMGALAYTHGRDVYFAPGQFAPRTPAGDELLAHELAHTVQQRAGDVPTAETVQRKESDAGSAVAVAPADGRHEGDADRGAAAATGQPPDSKEESGGFFARAADYFAGIVDEHIPGLLPMLRDGVGYLRDKVKAGIDATFSGIRRCHEGMSAVIAGKDAAGAEGEGAESPAADDAPPCSSAFGRAAKRVVSAISAFVLPIADFFTKAAKVEQACIEGLWQGLGKPAWEALTSVAGEVWAFIQAKATAFWEKIAWLRQKISAAWDWIKNKFGLAWDSTTGVIDWLKAKAVAAWEAVAPSLQPIMGPLKAVGAALFLLSGAGPIYLAWKAAPVVWDAVKWIAARWNDVDIVVVAQDALRDRILPAIQSGANTVGGLLQKAAAWLTETISGLSGAVGKLAETFLVSPLLRLAQGAVNFVAEKVQALATWVANKFVPTLQSAGHALLAIARKIQPILVVLGKLALMATNPITLSIFIASVAWRVLDDCVKPPIIDFLFDLLLKFIRALPEYGFFGESWPKIKASVVDTLEKVRKAPSSKKIEVSNTIAEFISGGDLKKMSNLFAAVRQAPDHFTGEFQEELIGMNLGNPLPFEKGHVAEEEGSLPKAVEAMMDTGAVKPEDAGVLKREVASSGDVEMTHVAELDLDPEFLDSLDLQDGKTIRFGESDDPSRTLKAVRADLAGEGSDAAADAVRTPTVSTPPGTLDDAPRADAAGVAPAPTPAAEAPEGAGQLEPEKPKTPDEQLDDLINKTPPLTCEAPKETGPQESQQMPEAAKPGPFTPAQRGRYLLHQVGQGIKTWYECHKTAIWVGLISALVVLIVATILTGGAALPAIGEAIGPLLTVLGPLMIGVAAVRATAKLVEFVAGAIAGTIAPAARALARGVAIVASEAVNYLLFEVIGKVLKAVMKGLAAVGRAVKSVAGRAVRVAGRLARAAGRGLKAAGKAVVGALERSSGLARRFLRRGRIVFEGLESRFAKGVKGVGEFASKLRARFPAKEILLSITPSWIDVYLVFNPKILVARLARKFRGLERDDELLARNLGGRLPDHTPHHLIGVAEAEKFPVMKEAEKLGYDVNRASNGINLPNDPKLAKKLGLPYHPPHGRHSVRTYTGPINERLLQLQADFDAGLVTRSTLLSEIEALEDGIRADLLAGRLRLNRRYPWLKPQP